MPCHDAHRLHAGAPGARVEQVGVRQAPVARCVHKGVVPNEAIGGLSGIVEAERAIG